MAAKQRGRPTHALARRPIVQAPLAHLPKALGDEARRAVGRTRDGAVILPVPPPVVEMPSGYAEALAELKQRIQQARIATVLTANTAMVRLNWHVGSVILAKQERAGWGAKVGVANWETQLVDKLPADLAGSLPTIEDIEAELADEPPARPSATKPARQTRRGARRGKYRRR